MYVNLVTWLGTGNYGTSLQSYALHEILKEMDYNVRFVHSFSPENFSLKKRLFSESYTLDKCTISLDINLLKVCK